MSGSLVVAHRWLDAEQPKDAEQLAKHESGWRLMHADGFYWLEGESPEGLLLTGRKDLLLTHSEFSETLSSELPLYRKIARESYEYDRQCTHIPASRELLTEGHKHALRREGSARFEQEIAVGLLGTTGMFAAWSGSDMSIYGVVAYATAVACAFLLRTGMSASEFKRVDAALRRAQGT